MIYFIIYIVLMFIFAGVFYKFNYSNADFWFAQAIVWPLTLLFFIGLKIGEKLK